MMHDDDDDDDDDDLIIPSKHGKEQFPQASACSEPEESRGRGRNKTTPISQITKKKS